MIRNGLVVAAAAMAGALAVVSAEQAPTIRSGVDGVVVPVSVTEAYRPVPGLTSSDFTLQDNGVAQDFTCTTGESLSVDVTLLIDTSASVKGKALEQFNADVQRIAESLSPNDRLRLITFAGDATDVSGLQPGGVSMPIGQITAGGATSLYNAVAASLIASPRSDRPQLVFAFSDGLDNMSFLDASGLVSLAGHSHAVLYLTLVTNPAPTSARGVFLSQGNGRFVPYDGGPNRRLLDEAANRTGGAVYQRAAGTSLSALFAQALDEFRSSYLLTFTPQGVKAGGWHTLTVKTKVPGRRVRSRTGYEGR